MREILIDPLTRNFVRDGAGGFRFAVGAETSVLHQLEIHFGGDWLAPEDGSLLHELDAFTGEDDALIKAELERCLGVLVRRGRISDVAVTMTPTPVGGRSDATVSYRDARTGRPLSFTVRR